jgi:RNA polymerase sigma-54 factor
LFDVATPGSTARAAPTPQPRGLVTGRTIDLVNMLSCSDDRLLALIVSRALSHPGLRLCFDIEETISRHRYGPGQGFAAPTSFALPYRGLQSDEDSLLDHVAKQIPLLVREPAALPIAQAWLEVLEPTGWVSETVEDVSRQAKCDQNVALHVLRLLQGAEPAGLFARSLGECLENQLRAQGDLSPSMSALLANLPLLADGDMGKLASVSGIERADLPELIARLRRLNPKPGTSFDCGPVPTRAPDLVLSNTLGEGWVLRRESWLRPLLSVSTSVGRHAAREAAEARSFLRSLERRDQMVITVAQAVLAAQADFLEGRIEFPKAVTPRQIADEVALHETTVRRIRSHLLIGTSRGTLALKSLFEPAIDVGPGGLRAVSEIKSRIASMVGTEGAAIARSDREIQKALAEIGIVIARRTIAKYRATLGIPRSVQRARRIARERNS